jgi:hypothetical protein
MHMNYTVPPGIAYGSQLQAFIRGLEAGLQPPDAGFAGWLRQATKDFDTLQRAAFAQGVKAAVKLNAEDPPRGQLKAYIAVLERKNCQHGCVKLCGVQAAELCHDQLARPTAHVA